MENNERDRKLDQWLDEALSRYSAAEPRLGLEQRVLAHVRADEQARAGRRTWWRWMPAFAAIAAVLVVMVAVRPYWEQKNTPKRTQTESSVTAELSNTEAKKTAGKTAESYAPAKQKESALEARTSAMAKDVLAAPTKASESFGVLDKREAVVRRGEENDTELKGRANEVAKKQLEASNGPVASRAYMAKTESSGSAAGTVVGGVDNVPLTSATLVAAPKPAAPKPAAPVRAIVTQSESIAVTSTAPAPEVQNGIVATEKVTTLPDVSARVKAMKAAGKAQMAKDGDATADTINVMGLTTIRTDLQHVPLGPVQQFPSPTPLSKQERLMLAASKQLKGEPATENKDQNEIKSIEIKKIEIAPLPGPEK